MTDPNPCGAMTCTGLGWGESYGTPANRNILGSYLYRTKTVALSDQRIKFMNEIISGMRVIKMYTWEKPFAKLVAEIRRLMIEIIIYLLYYY